jgi:predicted metal-dependent phosphoesterase TrpH
MKNHSAMIMGAARMLIDTHSHLDFPDFASDLDAVLARAENAGVARIITIGTSLESSRRAIVIAEKHPQVFAVVGVHPNSASEAPEDFITRCASWRGIPRWPRSARRVSTTIGSPARRSSARSPRGKRPAAKPRRTGRARG